MADPAPRIPILAPAGEGEPVTREATCPDCRAPFRQMRLNPGWLDVRTRGQRAALEREIPDAYVPTHCPTCTRRRLQRAVPGPPTTYAVAPAAPRAPLARPRRVGADDFDF